MKKRALIFTLSSLIVVLAATTSMSVAWYATSDLLRIEGIDVSLYGGGELLIATEDREEAYKNYLPYSELKHVEGFAPVSSMMSDKWLKEGATSPKFYDIYNSSLNYLVKDSACVYAEPVELSVVDGYYSQELYIKSSADFYTVIDTENTYFKPNLQANYKKAQEIVAEGKTTKSVDEIYDELNKLTNSIRFSILVLKDNYYDYKVIDPNKNEDTYYGGLMDTENTGFYDTCSDKDDKTKSYEVLYGEVNDRKLISYYSDTSKIPSMVGDHSWYNAEHDKSSSVIDMEASKANGLEIKKEEALSLEEYETIKQKIIAQGASKEEIDSFLRIPLDANIPTKIVLSIYFEGWDHDSLNSTMSASFISSIKFGVINKDLI